MPADFRFPAPSPQFYAVNLVTAADLVGNPDFAKLAEQDSNSAALWQNTGLCRAWDGDEKLAAEAQLMLTLLAANEFQFVD